MTPGEFELVTVALSVPFESIDPTYVSVPPKELVSAMVIVKWPFEPTESAPDETVGFQDPAKMLGVEVPPPPPQPTHPRINIRHTASNNATNCFMTIF